MNTLNRTSFLERRYRVDNELKGFPKFQWSVFIGGREGAQVVVRGNNFAEWEKNIAEVEEKFMDKVSVAPAQETSTTESPRAFGGATYVCNTCGAKAEMVEGTSKKGNYYKGVKCTADKDHFRFLSD